MALMRGGTVLVIHSEQKLPHGTNVLYDSLIVNKLLVLPFSPVEMDINVR